MTYISRANGQSVMAACAYYDGEQKYSEYDHQWKYPHSQPERVVLHEVMLPPNAPPEYADSERLWNAVDAAEKKVNAQTARRLMIALPRELTYEQNVELIRSYCDQEFVSKGMICDLYFHDAGDGNPHVHLLLTLRAMDEQGHWLPKAKTVYVLDENGNRIKNKDGKWRRQTIETVDWNDHKYGEIWRHNWEVIQNDALERADSDARVDMRSLERQGITDRVPQQHLGPAAAAMERKGIETDKGNENRRRICLNKMLATIKKTLKGVTGWLDELKSIMQHQEVLEHPQQYQLIEVMQSYMAMRKAGREYWSKYSRDKAGINDLKEMSAALIFMKENEIYTVDNLSAHLVKTRAEISAIENSIRSNEQSIRDINGFFEAVEVYNELKPVQDKLDSIHWKKPHEKYQAEHVDELQRFNEATKTRKRVAKKYGITLPLDKAGRKLLKDKRAELEADNEKRRPQLETINRSLSQLNTLRYWTRKVVPEALEDRSGFAAELDTMRAKRELNEVIDKAVTAVVHPPEDRHTEPILQDKETEKPHR